MATSTEQKKVRLKRLMFNKYDATEVDMYLESLNRRIRKMQIENAELVEKVKDLTVKLDAFRDKEESIHNALAMAEKVSTLCVKEARSKAEKILLDAKSQSSEVLSTIKCEAIEQKDNLVKLRNQVKSYRNSMLLLFKDHLKSLKEFMDKDTTYQEICDEIFSNADLDNNDKNDENLDTELSSGEVSDDTKVVDDEEKLVNGIDSALLRKRAVVNEKFKDLKFGKNYSSNVSSKKSFFGMFKKVR